ncbi:MAG: DUF378 domain-containing protein [Firmicutes bacterium]|nr:DUF378 domain-containing protein [Bacillota bacterium]
MMVLAIIATSILIFAGLNWMIVGFFNWNMVSAIFGSSFFAIVTYVIVGLAAAFMIYYLIMQSVNAKSKSKKRTPARKTSTSQS